MNKILLNFIIEDCKRWCIDGYDLNQNEEFWFKQTYFDISEDEKCVLRKFYKLRKYECVY